MEDNNIEISSGVDIVEIKRIEKSMENKLFLDKFFTKKEIEMFEKRKNIQNSVAANFAAKEAFSKALKTGVRGFSLKDIEVLRDNLGAPYFNFHNEAKDIVQKKNLNFSVSLSHTKKLAIAFVIAYKILL